MCKILKAAVEFLHSWSNCLVFKFVLNEFIMLIDKMGLFELVKCKISYLSNRATVPVTLEIMK